MLKGAKIRIFAITFTFASFSLLLAGCSILQKDTKLQKETNPDSPVVRADIDCDILLDAELKVACKSAVEQMILGFIEGELIQNGKIEGCDKLNLKYSEVCRQAVHEALDSDSDAAADVPARTLDIKSYNPCDALNEPDEKAQCEQRLGL